jgi:hypothetical protein
VRCQQSGLQLWTAGAQLPPFLLRFPERRQLCCRTPRQLSLRSQSGAGMVNTLCRMSASTFRSRPSLTYRSISAATYSRSSSPCSLRFPLLHGVSQSAGWQTDLEPEPANRRRSRHASPPASPPANRSASQPANDDANRLESRFGSPRKSPTASHLPKRAASRGANRPQNRREDAPANPHQHLFGNHPGNRPGNGSHRGSRRAVLSGVG